MPAMLLWNDSEIDERGLTTYESTVTEIGITQIRVGRGPKNHDIVYFRLNGLSDTFGLNYLDSPETIADILSNIKKEDTVKVIIDESGEIDSDGINYHLHHFASHGKIYFDNEYVKNRNRNFMKLFFVTGIIFMSCPIWLYIYVRKRNLKVLNG
jgi:hypothetical protein